MPGGELWNRSLIHLIMKWNQNRLKRQNKLDDKKIPVDEAQDHDYGYDALAELFALNNDTYGSTRRQTFSYNVEITA